MPYDADEDTYWGSYGLSMYIDHFGSTSAELRHNGDGVYVQFQWRGRDASEDETMFGGRCTGYIYKNKISIKGAFNNMYGAKTGFTGRLA